MRGLQQHKSVMSTPDNHHDRKSQIPEVTLFILPHPDRSEVSSYVYENEKRMGGVFF